MHSMHALIPGRMTRALPLKPSVPENYYNKCLFIVNTFYEKIYSELQLKLDSN